MKDKPQQGKIYALFGAKGEPCIAKGNTWEESEVAERIFKCWECGTKYPDSFCSTDDVSLCRWCSGEEE